MITYIWPIALIVLSNTIYQICAKSVPEGMNPFASLTVTYLVGALASAFLAAVLMVTGYLIYHEALTWNKIVGVAVCLIGLVFINYR